ncbi:TPA: GNAT family N-acetyltransferase [Vibrio cholerae]
MDVIAPNTEFSFKNAEISDLDFIYQEILSGASKGHFSELFLTLEGSNGLKQNLISILNYKRRLDSDTIAYGIIYHRKNQPVGFLIITAIDGNKGTEIWMMGITESYQGQGHGSNLLDEILGRMSGYGGVVMARCHPSSEKMYQMFKNRRFTHEKTSQEGARLMVR